MPKFPILALALVLLSPGAVASIRFMTPITLLGADLRQPLTEPRAAVSAADPAHVVVAAILAPATPEDDWDCVAFTTRNGGDSWQQRRLGIERCIDPWVVFADEDTVQFAGIRISRDPGDDDPLDLVFSRSVDGGENWSEPRLVRRRFEHPILLVHRDEVLLYGRHSAPRGDDIAVHILELVRPGVAEPAVRQLAEASTADSRLMGTGLTEHGERRLYAGYFDYGGGNGTGDQGSRHGEAWGLALKDGDAAPDPVRITRACAGSRTEAPLFPGYPFLTGAAGHLYHACIAPDHAGLLFSRSADGKHWSGAMRLDDMPDGFLALTPMLAAAGDGAVLAGWQERDPDSGCQRLVLRASADHGQTFGPPVAPRNEPSCPLAEANGRAGSSWPGGGDYSGIAVDTRGRFHVVWAATDGGQYRIAYTVIEVTEE